MLFGVTGYKFHRERHLPAMSSGIYNSPTHKLEELSAHLEHKTKGQIEMYFSKIYFYECSK
jgi:hypothetical protein